MPWDLLTRPNTRVISRLQGTEPSTDLYGQEHLDSPSWTTGGTDVRVGYSRLHNFTRMLHRTDASHRMGLATRPNGATMISEPVQAAVIALQQRALAVRDLYELDRVERALDELLRSPHEQTNSTPAASRIRSALGHAYETIERRREIAPTTVLDDHTDLSFEDQNYRLAEIRLWLQTEPTLAASDRRMLRDLANGEDATSLARRHRQPIARIRERISRARRHGRRVWYEKALVA